MVLKQINRFTVYLSMHVHLWKLFTLEVITLITHYTLYACNFAVTVSIIDIPAPVGVRAEVTADNRSIIVSWEWSRQGVLMCVDLVRVDYQPEGGSLIMHTVDNTTATSATLPNLHCNTKYTVWVQARGGQINTTSTPRMVSLPARGVYMLFTPSYSLL